MCLDTKLLNHTIISIQNGSISKSLSGQVCANYPCKIVNFSEEMFRCICSVPVARLRSSSGVAAVTWATSAPESLSGSTGVNTRNLQESPNWIDLARAPMLEIVRIDIYLANPTSSFFSPYSVKGVQNEGVGDFPLPAGQVSPESPDGQVHPSSTSIPLKKEEEAR